MKSAYRSSLSAAANRAVLTLLFVLLGVSQASAQYVGDEHHPVPTGKGWAEESAYAPLALATTGNRISWYGGPVMHGNVRVYYIWYGNWTRSWPSTNSQSTVNLLNALFAATGGIGGSPYARINTTYGEISSGVTSYVTGNIALARSTTDGYSQGNRISDEQVGTIVARALSSGRLPKDENGIYFVLTSSDVSETSGFCTQYCGWHTSDIILGADIKYAFVGNPARCPSACEAQTISPNNNSGADGMASIMAHEAVETLTDPDLDAWYDSRGYENADKCAWRFGPTIGQIGRGAYNQTFGTHHWLIQMNWENSRGGGCAQKLGGAFYIR